MGSSLEANGFVETCEFAAEGSAGFRDDAGEC
jgi:hypothetical protein